MKTRDDIISQAIKECYIELYKWSQPSIDITSILTNNEFKDDKECPMYMKHYLSKDNTEYIMDKYREMYGIVDTWNDTFDTLKDQLLKGGLENYYVSRNGDIPGYKDYKEVSPLNKVLSNPSDINIVIEYIEKVQNFFKWHSREVNNFNYTILLGFSPTYESERVELYWQSHGFPNFKIKNFKVVDIIYDGDEESFIKTIEL